MNLEFAAPDELLYARQQIFDADDIFGMGRIEAFESTEECSTFTIPQYGRLLSLSTHTHRYGKQFRVWYPPNTPCFGDAPDNNCEPPTKDPDYVSYDYADPLYQRFDGDEVLEFDGGGEEERTFKYCSVWRLRRLSPRWRRDDGGANVHPSGLVLHQGALATRSALWVC
jgi:hypothetical protein